MRTFQCPAKFFSYLFHKMRKWMNLFNGQSTIYPHLKHTSEKAMAPNLCTFLLENPYERRELAGCIQGSTRVRHDHDHFHATFFMHWRIGSPPTVLCRWQPGMGKPGGLLSAGHTESNTTEKLVEHRYTYKYISENTIKLIILLMYNLENDFFSQKTGWECQKRTYIGSFSVKMPFKIQMTIGRHILNIMPISILDGFRFI